MTENANKQYANTLPSIWHALKKIKQMQERAEYLRSTHKLIEAPAYKTIPFILQTQKGDPFFTWGKAETTNYFATVFFKIVKLEHDTGCATLGLLRPNLSIWDEELEHVKIGKIYEIAFVTETDEVVTIDPASYSAIKYFDPGMVVEENKEEHDEKSG
ncbi:CotY/CotZ family spore coat protein [uncultured Metabacillus sp.]|uniref:CotY/CotZ family spore coat protein n=1 Tax=uncultured Metabacillus sp. TaxID=2860135 RepID=UPI002634826A|nr:CotY/CotZ family spore coat protein [uncultured Metabacillus sp.]